MKRIARNFLRPHQIDKLDKAGPHRRKNRRWPTSPSLQRPSLQPLSRCIPMSMISYLTTIHFEFGAIKDIQQDLTDLGIRKPLIIADEGVAKAGLVGKITAVIDSGADLPVFTRTPTNPTEEAVEAALSIYARQGRYGPIAVGGGSPIDLAKGVALLATPWGPLE